MGALRKQMEADMVLRGLSARTRTSYLQSIASFTKFYGRSPARISELECQRYLLHLLQERKLAHSSCNVVASAMQFLYRVTRAKAEKLPLARNALNHPSAPQPLHPESVAAFWLRIAHLDIHQCPHCKTGRMVPIGPIRVPTAPTTCDMSYDSAPCISLRFSHRPCVDIARPYPPR